MTDHLLHQLKVLYEAKSKHSIYQSLAPEVKALLGEKEVSVGSKHEKERWDFMMQHLSFNKASVLDIGANTGYFSFQALHEKASHVEAFEGNPSHAEFMKIASELLYKDTHISIRNAFYDFQKIEQKTYDITFLLNVLHHVGDDFNDGVQDSAAALSSIAQALQRIISMSRYTVFQLGFCWMGDRSKPLFKSGTKREQIAFVEGAIAGVGDCFSIGIPVLNGSHLSYLAPNDNNIERNDQIGEFLNRPIFIIKSHL